MSKHRRKKISLKRTLSAAERRGLVLDKLTDQDVRWLFAGYKKGAFERGNVPEGMDPKQFVSFLEDYSAQFNHALVMRDKDNRVMSLLFLSQRLHILEAAAHHMPWTTRRDIVCGALIYFCGISGTYLGIKYALEDEVPYYMQMVKYGVLKKVGIVEDFCRVEGMGTKATLFNTKEVKTPWIKTHQERMKALLN